MTYNYRKTTIDFSKTCVTLHMYEFGGTEACKLPILPKLFGPNQHNTATREGSITSFLLIR